MLKKYREKTVNPSITISVNKIENRITFKIKTGDYIELLTPETMKRTMSKYENDSSFGNYCSSIGKL